VPELSTFRNVYGAVRRDQETLDGDDGDIPVLAIRHMSAGSLVMMVIRSAGATWMTAPMCGIGY
jgi:hypothetical protein